MDYHITSRLHSEHRDALENLIFLHPQQPRFREDIISSIEKFGSPKNTELTSGLNICLPKLPEAQTLYTGSFGDFTG